MNALKMALSRNGWEIPVDYFLKHLLKDESNLSLQVCDEDFNYIDISEEELLNNLDQYEPIGYFYCQVTRVWNSYFIPKRFIVIKKCED